MALRFESRAPWGSLNDSMRAAGRAVCAELGQAGATFVKERMQEEGKKDTGLTAQNVKAGPVEEPQPGLFRCVVATSPQQMTPAVVQEEGRKPGKGVSAAGEKKIETWVQRKGADFLAKIRAEVAARHARKVKAGKTGASRNINKEALDKAVGLIVGALYRRGLKPFKFFARAKAHVQERAAGIQKGVLARFGRGGMR